MLTADAEFRAVANAAFDGASIDVFDGPDLGHTYPRELNPSILEWLMTTDRG